MQKSAIFIGIMIFLIAGCGDDKTSMPQIIIDDKNEIDLRYFTDVYNHDILDHFKCDIKHNDNGYFVGCGIEKNGELTSNAIFKVEPNIPIQGQYKIYSLNGKAKQQMKDIYEEMNDINASKLLDDEVVNWKLD